MCVCALLPKGLSERSHPVKDLARANLNVCGDKENKNKNFGDIRVTEKGLRGFVVEAT